MDVKLPHLGEGADSGTVVNVFVKEGESITQGQAILELENEKAVATIPSTATGAVSKVFVKIGDKISVGQRILTVTETGKAAPKSAAPKAAPETPEPEEPAGDSTSDTQDQPSGTPHPDAATEPEPEPAPGKPVAAAPTIRRLARELGIDLSRVRGSARGGRVVMADLRGYIERLQKLAAQPKAPAAPTAPAQPAAQSIDFSKWGPITRKPMSSLREVIARRMRENWNAVPHVTQFDDADITGLLALRKKHLAEFEKKGARLTVTSFVLQALAQTLKQHPIFNASLDEGAQEIVFKDYCHIGIAVDTEAGLIVPVLRDADKKDLVQLSKDLEDLATRARARKVSADELKGGTFTVSNQGGIGGAHFTPIVNKPEVAILGLGRAAAKPVAREGKVEIRTLMPLAVSYDHRIIDGGDAARFVTDLVKAISEFSETKLSQSSS